MKYFILFPADYFHIEKVESEYEREYNVVKKIPEFEILFYNYDAFLNGERLKIYPNNPEEGICIYRGWMLKPEKYKILYQELQKKGIYLINNPKEYDYCHLYPSCYPQLKEYTPKMMYISDVQEEEEGINWESINQTFDCFLIKDYVKSVKGFSFPKYFQTPVDSEEMQKYIEKFKELRGELYTGGIVIKEYVKLKEYENCTNEYRVFYLKQQILTITQNSNQPKEYKMLPVELAEKFKNLVSNFYTIDFAELVNGDFIVVEAGDGQVSGLSEKEDIFQYYERMKQILGL